MVPQLFEIRRFKFYAQLYFKLTNLLEISISFAIILLGSVKFYNYET